MTTLRYYLAALAACTVWGTFAFVLRPLAAWSALDILFYRVFLSALLLAGVSLMLRGSAWKGEKLRWAGFSAAERRGVVRQVLGGGLFLTANWFSFIYVLNHVSIKAASLAYLVCPIITTVLAYFILKERLTRGQWGAIGLSVVGCLVLAFGHLADLMYAMVIAVSYAFYLVSQRKNYGVDKQVLLTLQVVFSGLLLLPFYPFYHGPVPSAALFYGLIAVIAVGYTIIPLMLSLFALKRLPSSMMGIILYVTPLLSFAIAVTCYGEKVDVQQGAAYGLIVAAIVLFNALGPFAKKPA